MYNTMTGAEVKLAMRIVGLRGTRMKATNKGWRFRFRRDREALAGLCEKDHAIPRDEGRWSLSPQGIDQLKLQIGEFHF